MRKTVALGWLLTVLVASVANAQSGSSATSTAQSQSGGASSSAQDTRPATTTFYGDTGLWFVPTAEVLPHKKF